MAGQSSTASVVPVFCVMTSLSGDTFLYGLLRNSIGLFNKNPVQLESRRALCCQITASPMGN
jgi:hypothetical protein